MDKNDIKSAIIAASGSKDFKRRQFNTAQTIDKEIYYNNLPDTLTPDLVESVREYDRTYIAAAAEASTEILPKMIDSPPNIAEVSVELGCSAALRITAEHYAMAGSTVWLSSFTHEVEQCDGLVDVNERLDMLLNNL